MVESGDSLRKTRARPQEQIKLKMKGARYAIKRAIEQTFKEAHASRWPVRIDLKLQVNQNETRLTRAPKERDKIYDRCAISQ